MSLYKIVTTGGIQKVIKEDGSEVDWLDEAYRTWLFEGNMPEAIINNLE